MQPDWHKSVWRNSSSRHRVVGQQVTSGKVSGTNMLRHLPSGRAKMSGIWKQEDVELELDRPVIKLKIKVPRVKLKVSHEHEIFQSTETGVVKTQNRNQDIFLKKTTRVVNLYLFIHFYSKYFWVPSRDWALASLKDMSMNKHENLGFHEA